jgi:membrane-anchored glycerophosphoryl diester phosphodiesterase (GDPDase)
MANKRETIQKMKARQKTHKKVRKNIRNYFLENEQTVKRILNEKTILLLFYFVLFVPTSSSSSPSRIHDDVKSAWEKIIFYDRLN